MEHYKTEVLVSVTTIVKDLWKKQLKEIVEYKIKRIALFLTCADSEERQKIYKRLEEIGNIEVPFVHARSDMKKSEYAYLVNRFHTELFNVHSESQYPFVEDVGEYRNQILIENSDGFTDVEEVGHFAGFCLDISHLRSHKLTQDPTYQTALAAITRYGVMANHISAVDENRHYEGQYRLDSHTLKDISQLDYLKKFPLNYFGRLAAIELNDDIATQVQAKQRIEEIIKDKEHNQK